MQVLSPRFPTSVSTRVRFGRLLRVGLISLSLFLPLTAQAESESYGKADAAWHQGELESAMALYEEAIAAGGLGPTEVVTAYSRIGTVRAAIKDKDGALSAFRTAATINPEFELPAESGPAAKKLFEQARAEAAKAGEFLSVSLSAPESVPARKEFQIVAVVPESYVVLVSEILLEIQDPASGKTWKKSETVAAEVTFKVPKRMAISGAELLVHASALDDKKNAWATSETKIRVTGARSASGMEGAEVSPFASPAPAEPAPEKRKDDGFFSGSTPWILGGATAAVITGVLIVFIATRPGDEAMVGAPSWQR